jgi:hypothetical protein
MASAEPIFEPKTFEEHYEACEEWVVEAAADLRLAQDQVWHDVTVNYLLVEVTDLAMRVRLARCYGIPLDMVGLPTGVH